MCKQTLVLYFCDECDSELPGESEQNTHLRNYHTLECNLCKFRLKNKEELDMHFVKFIHAVSVSADIIN